VAPAWLTIEKSVDVTLVFWSASAATVVGLGTA